jgi:hypothetical protein
MDKLQETKNLFIESELSNLREYCLSPANNICCVLNEINARSNILINKFNSEQDIHSLCETICHKCIWSRKT